jgi:hypothetical protein
MTAQQIASLARSDLARRLGVSVDDEGDGDRGAISSGRTPVSAVPSPTRSTLPSSPPGTASPFAAGGARTSTEVTAAACDCAQETNMADTWIATLEAGRLPSNMPSTSPARSAPGRWAPTQSVRPLATCKDAVGGGSPQRSWHEFPAPRSEWMPFALGGAPVLCWA